ncbi:MAG: hypothetical protein QS748_05920 [Candidatus Endonucleobacter bathymodioli]|uniref:Uncharacterized protein n=1 Tax=Candidatus Endonucleibacter bathymodioli TaxID=539814 RepID=A0AA90NXU4_9GAMM|nr:hypothetical protein [Candidatus Endonucleobacter bathymodioli]
MNTLIRDNASQLWSVIIEQKCSDKQYQKEFKKEAATLIQNQNHFVFTLIRETGKKLHA